MPSTSKFPLRRPGSRTKSTTNRSVSNPLSGKYRRTLIISAGCLEWMCVFLFCDLFAIFDSADLCNRTTQRAFYYGTSSGTRSDLSRSIWTIRKLSSWMLGSLFQKHRLRHPFGLCRRLSHRPVARPALGQSSYRLQLVPNSPAQSRLHRQLFLSPHHEPYRERLQRRLKIYLYAKSASMTHLGKQLLHSTAIMCSAPNAGRTTR